MLWQCHSPTGECVLKRCSSSKLPYMCHFPMGECVLKRCRTVFPFERSLLYVRVCIETTTDLSGTCHGLVTPLLWECVLKHIFDCPVFDIVTLLQESVY